jgi:Leucine-rich repeat (LRR) protein
MGRDGFMNPISLQAAITTLIQDQVNDTLSMDDNTIKAIFSITKEQFHSLEDDQQAAIKKFYEASSKSDLSTRPELAKLFLSFKKTLFTEESANKPSEKNYDFSIAIHPSNTQLANVRSFLSSTDLHKAAASSRKFKEFSAQELIKHLNQGEPAFSLGHDKNGLGKKALKAFLSKHGDKIHKLSLGEMKDLNVDDIESFIKLCPNLTDLSFKGCEYKLGKEALLSLLSKHGDKIHKLSLDEMKNLSADDIESFIKLCPNLSSLSFKKCKLGSDMTTHIVKALSKTKITHLDLSNNDITTIPPEIGKLLQLQVLDLSCNYHIAIIPPEIGNLSQLQVLDLSHNFNIVTIPPEIGKLLQLQVLNLSDNGITTIPPEIGNLLQLRELYLKGGIFSGSRTITIPPEIGNLLQLQVLDLSYNFSITTIPPQIGSLVQLKKLNLKGNRIQTIPPEIGNLLQLQVLDLSGNGITTIPPEIGKLSKLQVLELCNNQIQTIPAEIGKLSKLQELYLINNRIQTIPSEIGNLSMLQVLKFSHTDITIIPPEIEKLSQLKVLDLSRNKILFIPPQIGNLLQLQVLYLDANNIQTIPEEIGNLLQLQQLNLLYNKIQKIPLAQIKKLQQLQMLYLSLDETRIEDLSLLQKLYLIMTSSPIVTETYLQALLPNCQDIIVSRNFKT